MSTALDSVWDAYQQAVDALKIVRRMFSNQVLAPHVPALVKNTLFDGVQPTGIDPMIDALVEHLDDQTVASLFAAFEAELIDHVRRQEAHLRAHAAAIDPIFAAKLADLYGAWCKSVRIARVPDLFKDLAGATLVSQVDDIREYRNWLAHGKRWSMPAQVFPAASYKVLSNFLSAI